MPAGHHPGSEPRTVSADTSRRERASQPPPVRQAVALAATAGDPGDTWEPATRSRSRQQTSAAVPSVAATAADETAAGEEQPSVPRTAPAAGTSPQASAAFSAQSADERVSGTDAEAAAHPREDPPAAASATATAVPAPEGEGPSPAATDEPSAPGRPKKPMLAAAALVGAVLLAVPLLLTDRGDADKSATASAKVAQDTLLNSGEDSPLNPGPGNFVEEEKSPVVPKPNSRMPESTSPQSQPGTDTVGHGGSGKSADNAHGEGGTQQQLHNQAQPEPRPHDQPAEPRRPDAGQTLKVTIVTPHWETETQRLTNEQTGKCLVKDPSSRVVTQGGCNGDTWQRYVAGDGIYLLKNVAANQCLDSNGEQLYVSPCTTKDEGQLWRLPQAGGCDVSLVSKAYNEYLTGWNAGNTTLVGSGSVDDQDKLKWRAPSLVSGC
ncbi:RICIN domain-containing protein [Streptomyces sp. NPDC001177]